MRIHWWAGIGAKDTGTDLTPPPPPPPPPPPIPPSGRAPHAGRVNMVDMSTPNAEGGLGL